jgi:hypothetical protein
MKTTTPTTIHARHAARSCFGRALAAVAAILIAASAHAQVTVASFASPGSVRGGHLDNTGFVIGTVGTANDTNNWPAAESPDKATDGLATTKFLSFKNNNVGLILSPANAGIAYNRLAITTANDGPERDPAFVSIFGSNTVITAGTTPIGALTAIVNSPITLPSARGAGPAIVQFNNTTAFASYVVVFITVRGGATATSTQIAEVQLAQSMTDLHRVPMTTIRGGQVSGNTLTFGAVGTTNPGNN